MNNKELIRCTLMGDREAQHECTRSEIVLPCPKCGKGKIIYWDKKMKWYSCWDCGLKSSPKKSFEEALSNWNTRPAPPIGRCGECAAYIDNKCSNTGYYKTEQGYCDDFEPREE